MLLAHTAVIELFIWRVLQQLDFGAFAQPSFWRKNARTKVDNLYLRDHVTTSLTIACSTVLL
jgi:hypothetical protein